jgi:cell wall-associated NlpC family hydrolase
MNAAFLTAARGYLGTPWKHQGRVRGVGVDCVGLLVCVAREAGMRVEDVEGYDRMPVDRRLLRELDRHLERVLEGASGMRQGDVLAFSWSGYPYHVAILTQEDPPRIMHAWVKAGAVVENQLHDTWRRRIAGVWRPRASA